MKRPATAPEIDGKQRLVVDLYKECLTGERHFNDLQSVYRRIVAVWLIAAFTAVGYVGSSGGVWPVDRLFLATLIFLIASLGIWLLWCIDLLVYQRLLDSHFFEALDLEALHPWLPRIHTKMEALKSQQKRRSNRWWINIPEGNIRRAAIFYSLPMVVFLILSTFLLGGALANQISIDGLPRISHCEIVIGPARIAVTYNQTFVGGLLLTLLLSRPIYIVFNLMCAVPFNTRARSTTSKPAGRPS